jgi:hypothetical protein
MAASELNVQPQLAQASTMCGVKAAIGAVRSTGAARGGNRLTNRWANGVINPRQKGVGVFIVSPDFKHEAMDVRSLPAL